MMLGREIDPLFKWGWDRRARNDVGRVAVSVREDKFGISLFTPKELDLSPVNPSRAPLHNYWVKDAACFHFVYLVLCEQGKIV